MIFVNGIVEFQYEDKTLIVLDHTRENSLYGWATVWFFFMDFHIYAVPGCYEICLKQGEEYLYIPELEEYLQTDSGQGPVYGYVPEEIMDITVSQFLIDGLRL